MLSTNFLMVRQKRAEDFLCRVLKFVIKGIRVPKTELIVGIFALTPVEIASHPNVAGVLQCIFMGPVSLQEPLSIRPGGFRKKMERFCMRTHSRATIDHGKQCIFEVREDSLQKPGGLIQYLS